MDFSYLNNQYSNFNISIARKIFSGVENKLKTEVALFHRCIDTDNKNFSEQNGFSGLLETYERVENEDWIMGKSDKKQVFTGVGNIGVFYNGEPELTLYLALKCIKTGNNVVFFIQDDIRKTTQLVVDIINNECTKNGYNTCIKIAKYQKVAEVFENANNFNMFMFINEKQKYMDFIAKNGHDLKLIYSNYGKMDMYLDDKNLKSTLLEMDEYVYNNNIELSLYKDETVEEAVKKINAEKNNYCAVIFTKNKDDAYYFLKNVKAEKIFVNKNPAMHYKFQIDDDKLTIRKKIYI